MAVMVTPPHREQNWIAANSKVLAAIVVVVVVALATIGLIYSGPWSKIKVVVKSRYMLAVELDVFIDGELKATLDDFIGEETVGVWSVDAGNHVVTLDHGTWDRFVDPLSGMVFYDTSSYKPPDGITDLPFTCSVGLFHTKNVYIEMGPLLLF